MYRLFFKIREYPFSTYAKLSEKRAFLTPKYAHMRICISEEGISKNVSFGKVFAYIPIEWSVTLQCRALCPDQGLLYENEVFH